MGNTTESWGINIIGISVFEEAAHGYIYMHTLHTVLTVWRLGHTPGGSGRRTPPSTPSPAASSAVYPASAASVWSSAMMNMPPSPPHPENAKQKNLSKN